MTSCDYIIFMNLAKKNFAYPIIDGGAISVREAKAQFSTLLGRAAAVEVLMAAHKLTIEQARR